MKRLFLFSFSCTLLSLLCSFFCSAAFAQSTSEIIVISRKDRVGCLVTTVSSDLKYAEIIKIRRSGTSFTAKKIFGNPDRVLERFIRKGKKRLARKVQRLCLNLAGGADGGTGGGGGSGGTPGGENGGEEGEGGGSGEESGQCDDNVPFSTASNIGTSACEVFGNSTRSVGVAEFDEITPRIINGLQCSIGNSPTVRLVVTAGNSTFACTGSVITSRAVLFAAHCIDDISIGARATSVTIIPGGDLNNSVTTTNFAFSSAYDFGDDGVFGNDDIAIAISPCDLPTRAVPLLQTNDLLIGEIGLIAGYGNRDSLLNPGTDSGTGAGDGLLFAGKITISEVSEEEIISSYDFSENPIPGENSNTCVGDSGGPLVVERNGEWVLAGITSFGNVGCGPEDTSGFVNVTDPAVRTFIRQYAPDAIE